MTRYLAASVFLALAACAVGPRYQRPDVPVPANYWRAPSGADAASIADLPWWEMFRDPALQALVREAIANNQDLRLASARVEESRALLGVARADFYPQVSLGAGGNYGQQVAKAFPIYSGFGPSGSWSANLGVSWEIDLWGKIRNASDAAKATLLATEEGRRGTLITLVADVAQSYFELLELDTELEIARRNTVTRQGTLDLFTKRSQGGVGNDLEVNQARVDLSVTASAIPATERLIALKENQISVLLGRAPGPIARGESSFLPTSPPLPVGVPAALLERRPDVLAAEDTVKAATSSVGVAIANRLPSLSLQGLIGLAGPQLPSMFSANGLVWNVGGGLLAPIFEGGRLSSLEEAARAQLEETVAVYWQTVLSAYSEVSGAAVGVVKLKQVRQELEKGVTAARAAERLAFHRYEGGVSSYLEVLDAQRSSFDAELSLAQTSRDEAVSAVQLYRALGGGWQEEQPAPAKASPSSPEKG